MFTLPGSELFHDPALGLLERWYCRIFGIPIVGLRIRLRMLKRLLPAHATRILDAGCGRGVISRVLAARYPMARVDALDQNASGQQVNQALAQAMGLGNCVFQVGDLTEFAAEDAYDLIVSIDNLEHIEDDRAVLGRFHRAMRPEGVLLVHVPHYYRRWPVLGWRVNFDVPGHVRPGYHLPEIVERVQGAGFTIQRSGFSYGFLENLANNASYRITAAEERNRLLYALLFPLLNLVAWLGRGGHPKMGAGAWVVATKSGQARQMHPEEADEDQEA